ncbi:hypothetical protein MNB_SV-6-1274 [hydrothermal vent metagenome]|uniref:GH26 domain-containing protein n=1 Tax=hydrothermal vent metagenome TaxID=652676 RepID=A0A1W1BDV1_9ZZZZ
MEKDVSNKVQIEAQENMADDVEDETQSTETPDVESEAQTQDNTTDSVESEAQTQESIADSIKNETQSIEIFNEFGVGFGGSASFSFSQSDKNQAAWISGKKLIFEEDLTQDSQAKKIDPIDLPKFQKLQSCVKESKYIVYWLTKNWKESWFSISDIQSVIDSGRTPVFVYWYFGDTMSSGMPNQSDKDSYSDDNIRLAKFLGQLHGDMLMIMEPEFNKSWMTDGDNDANEQKEFAQIIKSGISKIKEKNRRIYFSLAMMDTGSRGLDDTRESCGYDNCALGDKRAWAKPFVVYDELSDDLDFISFQEMVGQFSRDPQNPGTWNSPNPKGYENYELGIDILDQRVFNFTKFLHDRYKKPIFLPYIAIATATWDDKNSNDKIEDSEIDKDGWNQKAENFYKNMKNSQDKLKNVGLFGYAAMGLFDNPSHDKGGYQFFMNNEYHLGIVATEASDEDKYASGNLVWKGRVLEYLFGEP